MKDNTRLIKTILSVIFFFSGVSALIYQVIWIRMLGQVFGLTIFAVSTVLTAFMAGLALGSYVFGKLIDTHRDPLLVFLLLELGIGMFALLFPLFLRLLTTIYVSLAAAVQPNVFVNSMFRFVVSFILLLFPTTLMGGTLPVLSRYYVKTLSHLGGNVGLLYSVNNLGAVTGCFVSSFFLIQIVGLHGNIYIAALINLLIAAVVFVMKKSKPAAAVLPAREVKESEGGKSRSGETEKYPPFVLRLVLWVFAIEGFTTLSYEVIWTRILLGISYDRSVYFYSIVIIAFIFGISLGSIIVARFIDRKKNLVFLLGAIEIVIGIIASALLILFVHIAACLHSIRSLYTEPWLFSLGKEYLIFFLLMLPPAVLMGMTFPIVAKIYTTNMDTLGLKLGVIGCLDTIGSIFGSFVAGFILIPFIGIVNAVIVTAVLNILIGIALIIAHPRMTLKIKIAAAFITISAFILVVLFIPAGQYFKHWQTEEEGDRLLFYKEGLGSTVCVPEKFDGVKELAIDGAVTAISEYGDIRVHKLLGYLPYLLSDTPRRALVVGFGMGITAQSLIQDEIEEVTCVEICTEIMSGSSEFFKEENRNVLTEPKLRVVIEDGRSYLAATDDTYDIITTNAVHPRLSINIYTREFYTLCRNRLAERGIMCQWMATNWMTGQEYKMLLKSFMEVFPHTSLWVSNIGHILLVGTPFPLQIDFREFEQKLNRQKIRDDLKGVHLDNPFAFLALFACGEDDLHPYLEEIRPVTDNFPLPEFSRYISMHPNLVIIDEILTYQRDVSRIVMNWNDKDEEDTMNRYVEAEKNFLKARYTDFHSPGSNTIHYLESAVRLNPYNYSFHHTLGDRYSEAGEYEKAIGAYKHEIELDPDNPLGFINIAFAYVRTNNLENALSAVEQAIRIDQDNGLAHYLLSIIYRMTLRFEEAAKELVFVTGTFPAFTGAYSELGEIYFALGRYKEAEQSFKTFIRFSKNTEMNKEAEVFIDELKKMGH